MSVLTKFLNEISNDEWVDLSLPHPSLCVHQANVQLYAMCNPPMVPEGQDVDAGEVGAGEVVVDFCDKSGGTTVWNGTVLSEIASKTNERLNGGTVFSAINSTSSSLQNQVCTPPPIVLDPPPPPPYGRSQTLSTSPCPCPPPHLTVYETQLVSSLDLAVSTSVCCSKTIVPLYKKNSEIGHCQNYCSISCPDLTNLLETLHVVSNISPVFNF